MLARVLDCLRAVLFFVLLLSMGVVVSASLVLAYPLLLVFDRKWLVAPRATCIAAYAVGSLFVRLEIEGWEHVPSSFGHTVMISNHQSSLDISILAFLWCVGGRRGEGGGSPRATRSRSPRAAHPPPPRRDRTCPPPRPTLAHRRPLEYTVVFKREILWYPGIGWCMWLSRYLSVDRRDRESGKALLRDAAATLRGGKDVLFFPEGTRQTDAAAGALGPFKPGAFKLACDTGAAVLPIAMSGARQLMPMARGFPRLRCGTVRLRIFPAIPSAGKTVEQLSDACRAAIEGGLRDCDVVLASASSSKKILPDKQG